MSKIYTYGTDLELQAISDCYRTHIDVHQQNRGKWSKSYLLHTMAYSLSLLIHSVEVIRISPSPETAEKPRRSSRVAMTKTRMPAKIALFGLRRYQALLDRNQNEYESGHGRKYSDAAKVFKMF
jgi:hypothetical protein